MNERVTIHHGADNAAIAAWFANQICAALAATQDPVEITLPGGSTPFPILEAIGPHRLDWHRVLVWPGDDRIVAEDHPASNVGRLRRLLDPLGARLVALAEGAEPPHFALTWLGMGTDGHVASLFPNTNPRADAPRTVLRLTPDPLPPEAPFDRLSLTIPALVNCDHLLIVARGEAKAALLAGAVAGTHDLPIARLLAAAQCPVTCFT